MSEAYDFNQYVDESTEETVLEETTELFIDPTGEVPDWIPDNEPNMYPEVPTVEPVVLDATDELFIDPTGELPDWIPDNDPNMDPSIEW